MLGKAKDVKSDAIIFDLEDAVSITEKDAARENVSNIVSELAGGEKEIIVRINALDEIWGYRDLLAIVPNRPSAVILPKADKKTIVAADLLIGAIERECGLEGGTVGLIPLFETAGAIANAYEILGASKRINGVQLGAEDLTKELEIPRTPSGEEIFWARSQLAMAAKARKIDILDTPYTGIRDLDGLRADTQHARATGFTGKTCIHPDHIETINSVFSPGTGEIAFAKGLLEAFEAAVAAGKGACMYEGKMIDAPVAARAQRIMDKARRLNLE
jgi:citrate lyase subunit beta/citryl-CoA lyase